jgi:hypothetical protein
LSVGYYGDLNRVRRHIDSIPGVDVIGVRANYDMRVEEFMIDVRVSGQHRTSIEFPDQSLADHLATVTKWRREELPKYAGH